MHNILSHQQLDGWRRFDTRLQELSDENDKLDDYVECIIECDLLKSTDCKRICRSVLM